MISINGTNYSIYTGKGAVRIQHGGGETKTPFIVGDATTNGTASAISTGNSAIVPTAFIFGSYTLGNIRVITTSDALSDVLPNPTDDALPNGDLTDSTSSKDDIRLQDLPDFLGNDETGVPIGQEGVIDSLGGQVFKVIVGGVVVGAYATYQAAQDFIDWVFHTEEERNPAQDKKLTKGEIEALKRGGVDAEELKGDKRTGQWDLFKDKKGNIYIKPKNGKGPGEETGININDHL